MNRISVKKILLLPLITLLFQSCKYDCQDAQKTRLWKWHGDGEQVYPDPLIFGGNVVITNDCYILDMQDTVGRITSGKKRFFTGDEIITVHFRGGQTIEYVSK